MTLLPPAPLPHPKTLEEQKSDFTAEGSPPPGTAGKHVPEGANGTKLPTENVPV